MTDSQMTEPDCNCNPDDYPPVPCQHKRSYSECMRAALASAQADNKALRENAERFKYAFAAAITYAFQIQGGYTEDDEKYFLWADSIIGAMPGDPVIAELMDSAIDAADASLVSARAEIAALKRPGYVSVPVEPTMGQWDDFCAVFPVPFDKFIEAYKAMLAASGEGKP